MGPRVATVPRDVLEVELTSGEGWPIRAEEVEMDAVERGLEMDGAGMGVHVEPITATLVDSEGG